MSEYGFHAGGLNKPSETLMDRGATIPGLKVGKTGWLGTGFFFYGDAKEAMKQAKEQNRPLQTFKLQQFKLFRPSDPATFYDGVRESSNFIVSVAKEGDDLNAYKDSLEEVIEWFAEVTHVPKEHVARAIVMFYKDVKRRNANGTLLTNRILEPRYDGIDNTGTSLDDYSVGSVIFADPNESFPGEFKTIYNPK